MGIIVYKNGVGLLWYELSYSGINSTGDYLTLLHELKELARFNSKAHIRIGFDSEKKVPLYQDFNYGMWIHNLLLCTGVDIHFWAERYQKTGEKKKTIPDKAVLFQYIYINGECDEISKLAYRVANGYDQKYNIPTFEEGDMYKPFGNGVIFTSSSGTVYVVCDKDTNSEFL